jgi:hypothetical protein
MHCRNCGSVVNEKAIICPNCGVSPFLEKKFCQMCGEPTNENQIVCLKCGCKLINKGTPIQSGTHYGKSGNPVISKKSLTIGGGIIFIVIIAGALWLFFGTNIILGKWQGGAFNEIVEFQKSEDHGYFAICTTMGTNMTSNAFQINQKLFKDVVISNDSILTGQILVPMTSGTQSWYNFTGTISKNLIKVYIGEAKWGWSYKKN